MKKSESDGDKKPDDKTNRLPPDMLLAREKALKATLKANEILSKAGSLQKELDKMEEKTRLLPLLASQQLAILICITIILFVLILFYSRAR